MGACCRLTVGSSWGLIFFVEHPRLHWAPLSSETLLLSQIVPNLTSPLGLRCRLPFSPLDSLVCIPSKDSASRLALTVSFFSQ